MNRHSYRRALAVQLEYLLDQNKDAEKLTLIADRADWVEIIAALNWPERAELVMLEQCSRHKGAAITLTASVPTATRTVCPNCEQEKEAQSPATGERK